MVTPDVKELNVKLAFEQVPDGRWLGTMSIPLHGPVFTGNSIITAHTLSPDVAEAPHKASTIMKQIAENPLLAAMMPPGAPLALHMATTLLDGVRSGKVHEALASIPAHLQEAAHGILASLVPHLPHLSMHIPGISGNGGAGFNANPYGYGFGFNATPYHGW